MVHNVNLHVNYNELRSLFPAEVSAAKSNPGIDPGIPLWDPESQTACLGLSLESTWSKIRAVFDTRYLYAPTYI